MPSSTITIDLAYLKGILEILSLVAGLGSLLVGGTITYLARQLAKKVDGDDFDIALARIVKIEQRDEHDRSEWEQQRLANRLGKEADQNVLMQLTELKTGNMRTQIEIRELSQSVLWLMASLGYKPPGLKDGRD